MLAEAARFAERILDTAVGCGAKIATAESCTAGTLATLLADARGAGVGFFGGFIVYSVDAKSELLGVPRDVIRRHTAVSREVAIAMAAGALERCSADIAVSVTGVAGPEPDEDGNPVGLVHMCVAARNGIREHREYNFADGERDALRYRIVIAALELVETVLTTVQSGTAAR